MPRRRRFLQGSGAQQTTPLSSIVQEINIERCAEESCILHQPTLVGARLEQEGALQDVLCYAAVLRRARCLWLLDEDARGELSHEARVAR